MEAELKRIQLVENSFERIKQKEGNLTLQFYQKLFDDAPQLKPLFQNTTIEAQSEKLLDSLILLVENLRQPQVLESVLIPLGKNHVKYGVHNEHYPIIGQCLMESLADFLQEEWTPEVEKAWETTLGAVVDVMLQGAAMATPKVPKDFAKIKSKQSLSENTQQVEYHEFIDKCFQNIKQQKEAFIPRFFENLFEISPEIKPLFGQADLGKQADKLYQSLSLMVENVRDTEILQSVFGPLGEKYKAYGVIEQHYHLVGKALIKTLEDFNEQQWGPKTEKAWQETYGKVVEIMTQEEEVTAIVEEEEDEVIKSDGERIVVTPPPPKRGRSKNKLSYTQKRQLKTNKNIFTMLVNWFWKTPKWVVGTIATVLFLILTGIGQTVEPIQIIIDTLEPLSIFIAVLLFVKDDPERKKQFHYQAWSIIDNASGIEDSQARIIALQDLCDDGVSLAEIELKGARLNGIELNGVDLSDANLSKANLNNSEFFYADLNNTNLSKSKCVGATFYRTNLGFSDFRKANCSSTNFSKSNLMFAEFAKGNFSGANFSFAKLKGVNFEGAYLSGANLKGAEVDMEELRKAYLVNAIMPDGSLYQGND